MSEKYLWENVASINGKNYQRVGINGTTRWEPLNKVPDQSSAEYGRFRKSETSINPFAFLSTLNGVKQADKIHEQIVALLKSA